MLELLERMNRPAGYLPRGARSRPRACQAVSAELSSSERWTHPRPPSHACRRSYVLFAWQRRRSASGGRVGQLPAFEAAIVGADCTGPRDAMARGRVAAFLDNLPALTAYQSISRPQHTDAINLPGMAIAPRPSVLCRARAISSVRTAGWTASRV